jgi:hypothetical protein
MIALVHLTRLGGGGEHHHGDRTGAGTGADGAKDVEAVEAGQLEIEKHESWQGGRTPMAERSASEKVIERLFAVARDADPILRAKIFKGPQK